MKTLAILFFVFQTVCWRAYGERVCTPNEKWQPGGHCSRCTCSVEGDTYACLSCPGLNYPPDCQIGPVDMTAEYPDCCYPTEATCRGIKYH